MKKENERVAVPLTVASTQDDSKLSADQHSGLILASSSPRRFELLRNLGVAFEVLPSNLEEIIDEKLTPAELVVDLATAKAQEVVARIAASTCGATVVLGADTVVVIDGAVIGKPVSRSQAIEMLSRLSGRCHEVYTGVCLIDVPTGDVTSAYEVSKVYMRALEAAEIEYYVETEEPMDKAGAYALQGAASAFVERIDGCFTNIIGLPIPLVVRLLRDCGIEILGLPR